jgi:GT2 family glycosyltransferase
MNRVSVVIPTFNRADDLKRCLDSLMAQTIKPDEIVIIDNGSTDGTLDLLKQYPVRIESVPKVQLSKLFNISWQAVQSDLIAYLNDDSEVVPGWLERILQTFDAFPQAVIVGGPTIAMREQEIYRMYKTLMPSRWMQWLARFYNWFLLDGKLFEVGVYCESGAYSIGGSLRECLTQDKPYPVTLLSITNMVIRRDVLEAMGGFDERFGYAHIDGDLFLRLAKQSALLVFDPKAVCWHHLNPTGLTRSAYVLGRDLGHLYRKHLPPHSMLGWLKFITNVAFFNLFWIYKAVASRNARVLQGISGFVMGMVER